MTESTPAPGAALALTATCPVCGGDAISDFLRLPFCGSEVEEYLAGYYGNGGGLDRASYSRIFAGLDFVLSECARCKASFQRNRPSPAVLAMVYDTWISSAASGRQAMAKMGLIDSQLDMPERGPARNRRPRGAGKRRQMRWGRSE